MEGVSKMPVYYALKRLVKGILPEAAVFRINRYRLRQLFHGYQPKLTTQRFGDCDLTIELIDILGDRWYAHDWKLPPEIPLLQQSRLKPGAVVFDLGAHQCVMAMLLSKSVAPNGFVLAVEGGSTNARAGLRNIQLNSISNCTVIHAVASAKSGVARFDAMGNGNVITESEIRTALLPEVVQSYSVDDLAAAYGHPDVVYVDVEGCECEVLEGANQTFRAKPDWFIEVHQSVGLENHGGSVDRVLSYFANGYQCYIAKQTAANDYSDGNEFELLEESDLPTGRFFLVAIAKPE
jgi:FkbM family methyltransferase